MKKILFLSLLIFTSALVACTGEKVADPIYEGRNLNIAVIGEFPDVRENNIHFEKITFDSWSTNNYDAIFISEENLAEAAKIENVQTYKKSDIPVFFLNTKASHIPFMELEHPLSYDEVAKQMNNEQDPIAGLFYVGEEGYNAWTFSYPVVDSQLQTSDIKSVYSAVFTVIQDNF
ncbi:hypothetical protein CEW92_16460 [Bacillaceae bacterium SAS-127]|nr:hypothetical protein CEW92_16460 [Bacillaceae bacterium SAS-127]